MFLYSKPTELPDAPVPDVAGRQGLQSGLAVMVLGLTALLWADALAHAYAYNIRCNMRLTGMLFHG